MIGGGARSSAPVARRGRVDLLILSPSGRGAERSEAERAGESAASGVSVFLSVAFVRQTMAPLERGCNPQCRLRRPAPAPSAPPLPGGERMIGSGARSSARVCRGREHVDLLILSPQGRGN